VINVARHFLSLLASLSATVCHKIMLCYYQPSIRVRTRESQLKAQSFMYPGQRKGTWASLNLGSRVQLVHPPHVLITSLSKDRRWGSFSFKGFNIQQSSHAVVPETRRWGSHGTTLHLQQPPPTAHGRIPKPFIVV